MPLANTPSSKKKIEIGSSEELKQKEQAVQDATERFYEEWRKHGEKIMKESGHDVNQDGGYLVYEKFKNEISLIAPRKGMSWNDIVAEANRINSDKLMVRDNENSDEKPLAWNLLQTNANAQKVARHLAAKFGTLTMTDSVGIWLNKDERAEIHFKRKGQDEYVILFKDIK